MESLNSIKAQGVKKIQSKKYNDAIVDFSNVISQLPEPANEEEVSLKCTCLINRATCNLMLVQSYNRNKGKDELMSLIQNTIDDSNKSIETLNKLRGTGENENYFLSLVSEKNIEKLKSDSLTHLFALSNLRLGESYDSLNEIRKAFQYYSIAYNAEQFDDKNPNYNNNQEARKAIRDFLQRIYNVPDIKPNGNNDDIKGFAEMRNGITDKSAMGKPLTTFLSRVYANAINTQTMKKLETLKYFNLIYAILHLYIDDQMIAIQAIAVTRFICNKHYRSFYDHLFILKDIMESKIDDPAIISECIKILALAPRDDHQSLVKLGFIQLAIKCFDLGDKIKDSDYDLVFCFLFAISQAPSMIHYLIEESQLNTEKANADNTNEDQEEDLRIVHLILEKRTIYGVMLLSKICTVKPVTLLADKLGATEWILSLLKGILDVDIKDFVEQKKDLIYGAQIFLSRLLLVRTNEQNQAAEKDKHEISNTIDILVPILKKGSKNPEVVSICFAYLAQATQYAPEKIKELHVVTLASLLLSMHTKFTPATQNIISFLYETADHAHLIDEIKGCKAALPTVFKAVHDHPRSQVIVERAVALAYLCDHESKDNLLKAALEQFPKDEFIEKFLADHEDLVKRNINKNKDA
ncbi:hypothetical protein M9Y10_045662 [Tritrichomonas musculus]|uniref:TPR Domain containing protein n=1 Tax=Tritrichomonas musculus TaxID=1915356 RepID=A0ABR2JW69_9EUKA